MYIRGVTDTALPLLGPRPCRFQGRSRQFCFGQYDVPIQEPMDVLGSQGWVFLWKVSRCRAPTVYFCGSGMRHGLAVSKIITS
eukprot:1822979-Pyramimonas_sp.AAC.1